jgi:hypothetical protein
MYGKSSFLFEDGSQGVLGDVGLIFEAADAPAESMITFGDVMTAEERWLHTQVAALDAHEHCDGWGEITDGSANPMHGLFPDAQPGMTDIGTFLDDGGIHSDVHELVDAMAVFGAITEPLDLNIGLDGYGVDDVIWDHAHMDDLTLGR